jgi:hypothetical protein
VSGNSEVVFMGIVCFVIFIGSVTENYVTSCDAVVVYM